MIAAGKAAFERAYGLKDVSACGSGDDCFSVSNPSQATVGTNAGWFHGDAPAGEAVVETVAEGLVVGLPADGVASPQAASKPPATTLNTISRLAKHSPRPATVVPAPCSVARR